MDLDTLYFFCEIDNVEALQKYIDNKFIKKKFYDEIILCCCDFGRSKILKWLIDNEDNLLENRKKVNYDEACTRALNNGYQKIAKYILRNKNVSKINQPYLFMISCINNYLDIAKILYSKGNICIQNVLVNCPDIFQNKNKKLINWINKILNYEKINDEFINLCEIGELDKIIQYYNTQSISLDYKNYESLYILTGNKNNEVLDWIISLNKLPNFMLFSLFVRLCDVDNLEMGKKIYDKIKNSPFFAEDNLNDLFSNQIMNGKITTLKNFHTLGLKITNEELIVQAIVYFCNPEFYGDVEHIKLLYELYPSYFEDLDNQIEIFLNICQFCDVKIIEWFYDNWKIFTKPEDNLYLISLKICCEVMNIDVAKWLANLFYEYQIDLIIHDNVIYKCTFKRLSNEKQIFKKIIFGQITGLDQFKSLKITKIIKDKSDKVDNCCICYNKPYNLIKLNCNHFCCITCLCHWYLSDSDNSRVCPYCRNEIKWSKCMKTKSNMNIIMENIEIVNKLEIEKNIKITNQYKEIKGIKKIK